MKYGIFSAVVEQIAPPISVTDIIYAKKIINTPVAIFDDENAARAVLKKYAHNIRENCDFDSTFDFLVVFIAPCEREFDNTDEPAAFADPDDYVLNFPAAEKSPLICDY